MDIEDILNEYTKDVKHDDKVTAKDTMFSEAVFVANEEDAKINWDDKNFWQTIGIKPKKQQELLGRGHRTRQARLKKKDDRYSGSEFDSSEMEEDEQEETHEDQPGITLIEALQKYLWGNWQQMYDALSDVERRHHGLFTKAELIADIEQRIKDKDNEYVPSEMENDNDTNINDSDDENENGNQNNQNNNNNNNNNNGNSNGNDKLQPQNDNDGDVKMTEDDDKTKMGCD